MPVHLVKEFHSALRASRSGFWVRSVGGLECEFRCARAPPLPRLPHSKSLQVRFSCSASGSFQMRDLRANAISINFKYALTPSGRKPKGRVESLRRQTGCNSANAQGESVTPFSSTRHHSRIAWGHDGISRNPRVRVAGYPNGANRPQYIGPTKFAEYDQSESAC